VFFCKRWASFFEIKQPWAPFVQGFSPDIRQIKTFGDVLATPLPTPLIETQYDQRKQHVNGYKGYLLVNS